MDWKEPLTYLDAQGKRHWRPWIYGFLICLGVLAIVGIYAGVLAARRNAEAAAIDATATVQWALALTPEPTRTPTPLPPTPTPVPCPTDPAQWTLTSMGPQSIDKISPACVYDGLAKSVAFLILTESMGWTTDDAVALLQLPRIPAEYHHRITSIANAQFGPYTTDLAAGGVLTDGAEWAFTKDLKPAYAYALYGCYKPEPGWGTNYPVVCNVVFDSFEDGGYNVSGPYRWGIQYDDAMRAQRQMRQWIFFGYNPKDSVWAYLGTQLISSYPLSKFPDHYADLTNFASAHGLPVWDGAWVEKTWGATMKPLPEDWSKPLPADEGTALNKHLEDLYRSLMVQTEAPK